MVVQVITTEQTITTPVFTLNKVLMGLRGKGSGRELHKEVEEIQGKKFFANVTCLNKRAGHQQSRRVGPEGWLPFLF